jgi:hypothetical protein
MNIITEPSTYPLAISLTFASFYAYICAWTHARPDFYIGGNTLERCFTSLVSIGVILEKLLFCAVAITILVWHGWLTALAFVAFIMLGFLLLRLTIIAGFLFPPLSLWVCNVAALFFFIKTLFER